MMLSEKRNEEIKIKLWITVIVAAADRWLTVRLWRLKEDHSEDVESHEEDGGGRWYSLLFILFFDVKLLSDDFLDF